MVKCSKVSLPPVLAWSSINFHRRWYWTFEKRITMWRKRTRIGETLSFGFLQNEQWTEAFEYQYSQHPLIRRPDNSTFHWLEQNFWSRKHLSLKSVPWILAEFYFNRGLQRPCTGTCTILQKRLTGFFICLLFFLKVKYINYVSCSVANNETFIRPPRGIVISIC